MTQLVVIKETEVLDKKFNIYGDVENPLFLAQDVAKWIEHSNTTEMLKTIDSDEKLNSTILSSGQNRVMSFLTEDGLYEVLMQSRKPIAKQFKKQVKAILKDLRLYGQYTVPRTYADALELALNQQRLLEVRNQQLAVQNQVIGELQPKADYVDSILKSKSLVTITQIAKDYGMSAIAMNKLLKEEKVQFKQSDQWMLYRKYHNKGYTQSETYVIEEDVCNGEPLVSMTTKWTQKGRMFLYDLLKSVGVIPLIERDSNE